MQQDFAENVKRGKNLGLQNIAFSEYEGKKYVFHAMSGTGWVT